MSLASSTTFTLQLVRDETHQSVSSAQTAEEKQVSQKVFHKLPKVKQPAARSRAHMKAWA